MTKKGRPKRGHGEGGTIWFDEKRKRWTSQIMLGYKPDGKPDRRTVRRKTQREVIDELARLKTEYREGTLIAPNTLTVGQYLVGDVNKFLSGEAVGGWLETHRRFGGRNGEGLRPNTYRGYASVIKNHILPEIGQVRIQDLTPTHLEGTYKAILDKKTRDGKNLSMRQAEYAHRTIRLALSAAVEKGIIKNNPADRVPHKPRTRYRAEDRPRLARADIPRVLDQVRGTRYYVPFLLAMAAGLRRGEIVGLRWRDVDLNHGVIHVRKQIQLDENGKPALEPLKTEASIRDIPIPMDVTQALRRHRASQKVVTLDGFVCTNSRGGHLRLWDLNAKWGEIREKLNLPKEMVLHDLRGSWVTWLAEAKVDVKAASQLLGHGDVKTTLALYQSVTEEMRMDAARAMAGITQTASTKEESR